MSENITWSLRTLWTERTNPASLRGMVPFPRHSSSSGVYDPISDWDQFSENRLTIPYEEHPFLSIFRTVTVNTNFQFNYRCISPAMPLATAWTSPHDVDACGKLWSTDVTWVHTAAHTTISMPASMPITLALATGGVEDGFEFRSAILCTDDDASGFFAFPGVRLGARTATATRSMMCVSTAPDLTGRSARGNYSNAGGHHMRNQMRAIQRADRRRTYRDPGADYAQVLDLPTTMSEHIAWPAWSASFPAGSADTIELAGPRRNEATFSSRIDSSGYDQVRFVFLLWLAINQWICDPGDDPILNDDGWSMVDGDPASFYDGTATAWYDDGSGRTTFHTATFNVRDDMPVVGYAAVFQTGSSVGEIEIYSPLAFSDEDPVPTLAQCLDRILADLRALADSTGNLAVVYVARIRHGKTTPAAVPTPPAGQLWTYGSTQFNDLPEEGIADVWTPRRDLPSPYAYATAHDIAPGAVPS